MFSTSHCVLKCLLTIKSLSPVSIVGYKVAVWTLVAITTFPLSFLKQCVSVLQLVVACQNIAALDVMQRARRSAAPHH